MLAGFLFLNQPEHNMPMHLSQADHLCLILADLTNDDLACGHDRSNTVPAQCIHTTFDPEGNNMGDEAFVNPYDDWTDDMDYVH